MPKKKQTLPENYTPVVNDLLMKPFSLGWTREVVRRVATRSKTPQCDIYYFTPNKIRIRSMIEVKGFLTHGLSPECFYFKKVPLGLSPDLEIIRDAQAKGKGGLKVKDENVPSSAEVLNELKGPVESENSDKKVCNNESEAKKKKIEVKQESKFNPEPLKSKEMSIVTRMKSLEMKIDLEKKKIGTRAVVKRFNEIENLKNEKNVIRLIKPPKPPKPAKFQSVKKRKSILKNIRSAKQAKQAKIGGNRTLMKKIASKKDALPKKKLIGSQKNNANLLKTVKKNPKKFVRRNKPLKNSLTKAKMKTSGKSKSIVAGKKSSARDVKNVVTKKIEKQKDAGEKHKLQVKTGTKSTVKKIAVAKTSRTRSKPISKNRKFYLKPLKKGWRRELVFRTNCRKPGIQADVYYLHPSGKRLRSSREVAENLTRGLSIEWFTFRKEPLGCGEPSEVIRNARFHHRN